MDCGVHFIGFHIIDLITLTFYILMLQKVSKNGTWKGSFIVDDFWEPYSTLSINSIKFKRVWFISDMILWAFLGSNKQGNKVTQKFNAYLQYWSLVSEGTSQIGSQTGRGTQDNGLWPLSIRLQILKTIYTANFITISPVFGPWWTRMWNNVAISLCISIKYDGLTLPRLLSRPLKCKK